MADSRIKDGLRTAPAITMPAYKHPAKGHNFATDMQSQVTTCRVSDRPVAEISGDSTFLTVHLARFPTLL